MNPRGLLRCYGSLLPKHCQLISENREGNGNFWNVLEQNNNFFVLGCLLDTYLVSTFLYSDWFLYKCSQPFCYEIFRNFKHQLREEKNLINMSQYRKVRQIGKGSFGSVLLVEDLQSISKKNYVIKQVNTANMSLLEQQKVSKMISIQGFRQRSLNETTNNLQSMALISKPLFPHNDMSVSCNNEM